MVQADGLNDAVTSYIVSDWFLVDGKWRELIKTYEDGKTEYYCDGKHERTVLDEKKKHI